jgi:hypothetical protein
VTQVELDKSFTNPVQSLGSIQIRVVVLSAKAAQESTTGDEDDGEPDDELLREAGKSPLGAYLEQKRGRQCVVFLVNGQRHDGWDSSFVSVDLGFKYLRTRTMIVVDLDGLTQEATAEIVQGSRQGLYEGDVMVAITDRIIATLKKDPDLVRLQAEAEQEIAELQSGDEVVRQQLDQLIEAHHPAGSHTDAGADLPGSGTEQGAFASKDQDQPVVSIRRPHEGEAASAPVLAIAPDVQAVRLRPDTERKILLHAVPESAWSQLESIEVRIEPKTAELSVVGSESADGRELTFLFEEAEDADPDGYPVQVSLQAFAKFKGIPEVRKLECDLVVSPPKASPPRPKPVLSAEPSFLRVGSRQPIKLVPGGAAVHVRIRWDGLDSLVVGPLAAWSFSARCLSLGGFPPMGMSQPREGSFELLIDAPHGLRPGVQLQFEVEATGPSGRKLVASFVGQVREVPVADEPRRTTERAPQFSAQRRPPYDLRYVNESNWNTPTSWGEKEWTRHDAGAFQEPTNSTPLTLIINSDAAELKAYRDALIGKSLDESTIARRVTKYTAHVAFHLYQMYEFTRARREQQIHDSQVHVPSDEDNQLEIARVASTLLRLMEISQ